MVPLEARIVYLPIFVKDPSFTFTGNLERSQANLNTAATAFDKAVGSVFREAIADTGEPLDRLSRMTDVRPAVRKHVESLISARQQMLFEIEHVEHHVEENLRPVGLAIAERLKLADKMTDGMSMLDRIACRVAAMGGKLLPTLDFDRTTTVGDEHISKLPTYTLEQHLKENNRTDFLGPYLTTVFALMAYKNVDMMRAVGKNYVLIRPGANDFVLFSRRELDVRPVIISANFETIVSGGLENIPAADGNVRVTSVNERTVLPTQKGVMLKYLARTNSNRAVSYAGDGLSDENALTASENVAYYLALRGEKFETLCQNARVPYLAFADFKEILQHTENIMNLVPKYINKFDGQVYP